MHLTQELKETLEDPTKLPHHSHTRTTRVVLEWTEVLVCGQALSSIQRYHKERVARRKWVGSVIWFEDVIYKCVIVRQCGYTRED